jgi:hypothetical protein
MILAKNLTLSDITLIREFVNPNRKQQAVVLPKDFLRSLGFEYSDYQRGFEIPLDLKILGPGSMPEILKPAARISRHSKDWRLDRCVIREDEYSPGSFSAVKADDVLLLSVDFDSGSAIAIFLCKSDAGDAAVISSLGSRVGRKAGFLLDDLLEALESAGVDHDHSVWKIVEHMPDSDIVQAGRLAAKRAGFCSPADLKKRLEQAQQIGLDGEKLFSEWLDTKPMLLGQKVEEFMWISQDNAVSPYDFVVELHDGSRVFVEVKTTTQKFSADLYVSFGELSENGGEQGHTGANL